MAHPACAWQAQDQLLLPGQALVTGDSPVASHACGRHTVCFTWDQYLAYVYCWHILRQRGTAPDAHLSLGLDRVIAAGFVLRLELEAWVRRSQKHLTTQDRYC